jgi:hypothetical protein
MHEAFYKCIWLGEDYPCSIVSGFENPLNFEWTGGSGALSKSPSKTFSISEVQIESLISGIISVGEFFTLVTVESTTYFMID